MIQLRENSQSWDLNFYSLVIVSVRMVENLSGFGEKLKGRSLKGSFDKLAH